MRMYQQKQAGSKTASVVYRVAPSGGRPGNVVIQRRVGSVGWAVMTDTALRESMSTDAGLAQWVALVRGDAGDRRQIMARKDPLVNRIGTSMRLHPDNYEYILAEAKRLGVTKGEVVDQWAEERRRRDFSSESNGQ